jgi:hypothetical protein
LDDEDKDAAVGVAPPPPSWAAMAKEENKF